MFRRPGRKKLFVIPLAFLLRSLRLSAIMLHPVSAAGSTLAQAGAASGRTIGGFGVNVTINNTGSAVINGWTLAWTFANGQTITQIWNASDTQAGGNVRATNLSYDATIAPGSNTSFGFNGAWNGSNTAPTSFTLNGATCRNV